MATNKKSSKKKKTTSSKTTTIKKPVVKIEEEKIEKVEEVVEPKKTKKKLKFKGFKFKKKEKNVNDDKLKKYKIRNILLILIMLFGIAGVSAIIAFSLYIIFTTEKFDPNKLLNKESTVLYDINGNEFARLGTENRDLVTYDELPQVLIDAIVATEDARYFQHNGLDIARFAKATIGQLAGQAGAGGASTLTMQIAKQSYNGSEASGMAGIIRKFRDIYLSVFKIEKLYTKEEIMEFYVNTPGLGWNTFGVEQASQTYFGKSVRDLTLAEASLLAGIFNAPSAYNPFSNIELATKRRSIVLNLMVHHGYITEEQRQDAESISVESLLNPDPQIGKNPYQPFIDVVINEVIEREDVDPANVSMEIYTTLDPSIQDILNALNNEELGYKWVDDYIQVAVAVTSTKDGSIMAINGGRNYNGERMYNRATSMVRHPGSTAKPIFAYGPYIEYNNGSTYTQFFDDKMTYSNGTQLKNSDGTYLGLITMRTALKRSRNIPAVQAFQQTDKEKIAEFASNLHIRYGDEVFESMAIGGFDGASPLDLSAAYAAFGRGGYYIEPYSFTKIVYKDTNETKEFKYEAEKAMSPETAYLITDILVSATAAGVGGDLRVKGAEIASKTGTSTYGAAAIKAAGVSSTASRDNWTNFYSSDYSISIWYGYDKLMTDYYTTALGGAAQKKKIATILGNKIFKPNSKFKVPSGIVSSKVEAETFPPQLPSEFTPKDMITTEKFKKGTEPTEVSDRYNKLNSPTNGNYYNNGSTVTLTWSPIDVPNAINPEYLEQHFKEYYREWNTKYYDNRLNYNKKNIGTLGYQVYQEVDGKLNSIGYTNNTSYDTVCVGQCKFVIKSTYSIFKNNASDGLTINVDSNYVPETPVEPTPEPNTQDLRIEIYDACLPMSIEFYNDEEYTATSNPIKVYFGDNDVTNESSITRNVNIIDRTTATVNTITYTITYNGITKTATRRVTISNTCN